MRTLLKFTKLTDGAITVEVAAGSLQPLDARGVIYSVLLDISTDDILTCLAGQGVHSLNRFSFKCKDSLS